MVWVISATKHKNQHAIIKIYNDIIFMVKFFVAKKVFEKTLGCDSKDNVENTNTDLFPNRITALAGGIFL